MDAYDMYHTSVVSLKTVLPDDAKGIKSSAPRVLKITPIKSKKS